MTCDGPKTKYYRPSLKLAIALLTGGLAMASIPLLLSGCGGSGSSTNIFSTKAHTFRYYYVYTANAATNDISAFRGNQDGSLTFIGKTACAGSPTKIVGDTEHLYALIGTRIQVFSGIETGKLSAVQTLVDPGTGGTAPSDLALGYSPTGVASTLYVMCTNFADSNKGDLVALTIAANGSLAYGTGLIRFNKPTALVSLGVPGYLAVANSGNDTVDVVKASSSSLSVAGSTKVGTAATADFNGLRSDFYGHIYVSDRSTKSLSELWIPNFNSIKPEVKSAIKFNATCLYFGTTSGPANPAGYSPVLLSLDKEPNIGDYFSTEDPVNKITFQRGSGGKPELGTNPTAINGLVTVNIKKSFAAYAYSTTSGGSVRFYSGDPDGGHYIATYDSTGSGLSDILVTGEIGAVPPIVISPTTLPDTKVKAGYRQTLTVTGGDIAKGEKVSISEGSLPPGLELIPLDPSTGTDVAVDGVPTTAGTYTFTVKVQRGDYTGTQKYTMAVTGGSSTTTPAVFVNDTTNAQDSPLSALIAGTTLQATQGNTSPSTGIAVGSQTVTVKRSGGHSVATQSISTDQQHHYVLITVGNPTDGYNVIEDQFDIGSKPPTKSAWFTFYPGVKGLTETVDFYLLLPGGSISTTPYKVTHVAPLATTSTLTVPIPSSLTVTLVATEPDQPNSVIALKTVSLSAGGSFLGTLVSPEGASATFDVNQDTLK